MVDAHCHLNFHAYKHDVDEVIERAKKDKIEIINVGTTLSSSITAIELAKKYPGLYATVGIHPHHADKLEEVWEEKVEKLAKHPKVIAIGETGIDYFHYESNGVTEHNLQKKLFAKQINIAHKLDLPLMVHNRQAGKDILEVLNENRSLLKNPPGLFHCFSGDIEFLKKVLDLGFYIGFDGNITYPGIAKGETTSLADLVKHTPIDRIMTETDSPFLTPIPYRGSRNEPSYVIIVAEFIAKIKGLTKEEVIEKTTSNAHTVFRLG
ncbi:TatD family hydrolase [Patescibacteria group bacterium]|nr:TatD family hydrolase [Patescibacteria group bacterium]